MSTSAPHPSKNVLWNSVELLIIIQQFEIKELGKKDSNSIFKKGNIYKKKLQRKLKKKKKTEEEKRINLKKREMILDFVWLIVNIKDNEKYCSCTTIT